MSEKSLQSPASILHAIRSLSPDDRRTVYVSIMEEFPEACADDSDSLELTRNEIDELDCRVAEFESNPASATSWEDFEKELTQRFGAL